MGLDKNKSHTFKLIESLNREYIDHFELTKDKLHCPVRLMIEGRIYPAKIRWARLNRTKVVKLRPEDLRKRDAVFFEWGSQKHISTQNKMRDVFRDDILKVESGESLTKRRFQFHHLNNDLFMMVTEQDSEFVE